MINPIYVGGYYMSHLHVPFVGYTLGLRLPHLYSILTLFSWKLCIYKNMGLVIAAEGIY